MGNIFNTDFRDFIQALNDAQVAYMLVGGYAVILHGRSRTTGDMDVWVKPTDENYQLLMLAFSDFGLPAVISLDAFLNPDETDVFSFGRSPVAIDIMTRVKGLSFDECLAESKIFEDDGLLIRTVHIATYFNPKKQPDDIKTLTTCSISNLKSSFSNFNYCGPHRSHRILPTGRSRKQAAYTAS